MTIEQLDAHKVLISLCNEDMESFSLRFNTLSFCDEHSRKVLVRLTQLACVKTGLQLNKSAVLMEALPHQSGCLLLLTVLEKPHRKVYKVKRYKSFPCFVFNSAEDLLSCAESIGELEFPLHRNSLWLFEGRYYLVFDYPVLHKASKGVLCEYSKESERTAVSLSRIKESGKLLYKDRAVEGIYKAITCG